ncbi:C-type lectin domain family 6 member A-like [Asterias rubens]|uniref:C-type lectin domain family 6 member A-like n=1 Tax=Asterias rubens TaxID=7604 RepID=UPI0014551BB9|nr:C-type lectin domain family 6 member A-like [Asterias rubens]
MNIFKVSSLLLILGCGSILAGICQQKNCQHGNCPPDWRKDGASCYFIITEKMTWNNAKSLCTEYGATLGIPNSQSAQEFIWEFFLQKIEDTTTPNLWIGLIKAKGHWDGLLSNTSGSYKNWAAGQPDSIYLYCAAMWGDRGGKWDDQPCYRENYAVCELPVPVTNTPLFCLYTGDDGRLSSQ